MAPYSRTLGALEHIQALRNFGLDDKVYNWQKCVDESVKKQVEKKHEKLVADIRAYHEKHPDFP